jgi:hypothetical protein
VVQDVGTGVEDDVESRLLPLAVGDEDLDCCTGTSPANGGDRLGKGHRTAIGEIVARDGRDDRV